MTHADFVREVWLEILADEIFTLSDIDGLQFVLFHELLVYVVYFAFLHSDPWRFLMHFEVTIICKC